MVVIATTGCSQKHNCVFQDQTVVDSKTGLMWSKNTNMPDKPLLWKADGNVYAFVQKLHKNGYASYFDWRVPTYWLWLSTPKNLDTIPIKPKLGRISNWVNLASKMFITTTAGHPAVRMNGRYGLSTWQHERQHQSLKRSPTASGLSAVEGSNRKYKWRALVETQGFASLQRPTANRYK